MRIDAVGADPVSGQLAEGDLHLELAPGALIENLSFEIRVNGSNGTWIEQPQLSFVDTQTSIMDWRGLGGFGQQNDLMGSDPHSSRLTPNADAGASWLLPGDAEVTDLVVEALRPADTYVSLTPLTVNVNATAIHPVDGRLYMLIGETLMNPNGGSATEVTDLIFVSGEILLATDGAGVMRYDVSNNQWLSSWDTQNSLPSDKIIQLEVVNGILMIAMADAGIVRYNIATSSWLATWTDANWLDSNNVHGMEVGGEWLHILAGNSLHFYNVTMGAFSSSKSLQSLGLVRGGMDLVAWPSSGDRGPNTDVILASDGSGSFAQLEPATPPIHTSTMLLASGPSSTLMFDVLEINNTVWVAGDEVIDIFDKQQNRWLNPIVTGTDNQALETDGSSVWLATKDDGIFKYSLNGSQIAHIVVNDGLNSNDADFMAYDSLTDTLVVGHSNSGVSLVNNSNNTVSSSWSSGRSDQFSNNVRDVAARSSIAYVASNIGVIRIDITNDTLLSTWSSTGMDDVLYMPVETDGRLIYLGMYGYGVLVFDRVSGDVLDTWKYDGNGNGLSSNNVYSLHKDTGGSIWVGVSGGADRWDGTNWDHIRPSGGGWQPTEFYDLTSDSSKLYAGTNAGACMYDLSSLSRDDCWNYYSNPEGLPSSWVYSVSMLSNGFLYFA